EEPQRVQVERADAASSQAGRSRQLGPTVGRELVIDLADLGPLDQLPPESPAQDIQEARVGRPDRERGPLDAIVIGRDPTEPLELLLSGGQRTRFVNHEPSSRLRDGPMTTIRACPRAS